MGSALRLALALLLLVGCGVSVREPLVLPVYEKPALPDLYDSLDPTSLAEGVQAPHDGYLYTPDQHRRVKAHLEWAEGELVRSCEEHVAIVGAYATDAHRLVSDQLEQARKELPRAFAVGCGVCGAGAAWGSALLKDAAASQ